MASRFKGPLKNATPAVGSSRRFEADMPHSPIGEIASYVSFFKDFVVASEYTATDWVVTETQAGATQGISADVVGGAFKLVNSTTDDDVNQIQLAEEIFKLSAGKQLWFDIKMKVSAASVGDFFVGLATTDTTIIAGTTDSCGFRKLDGTTTIKCITEDNTTETTTSCNSVIVADTYTRLSFRWDGKNKVEFFQDGSYITTHTANIEQTNALALTIMQQQGDTNAGTLTIDYINVVMER